MLESLSSNRTQVRNKQNIDNKIIIITIIISSSRSRSRSNSSSRVAAVVVVFFYQYHYKSVVLLPTWEVFWNSFVLH